MERVPIKFTVPLTLALLFMITTASFCDDCNRDIGFLRIGTYRGFDDVGLEYQKTYLVPRRFTAYWLEAKRICYAFDLQLASFETLDELNIFLEMMNNSSALTINSDFHIDGMTNAVLSIDDWYWTNNGKKIPFEIPWGFDEPNNASGYNELCLALKTESTGMTFNDVACQEVEISFVCQRIDFYASK